MGGLKTLGRLQFAERLFIILATGFAVLFVLLLVVAQWPEWWKWVIFEESPMAWLEFTLLYSCGLLGLICTLFAYLRHEERRNTIYWSILSLGFLYLALDERFALHERLRDKILEPVNFKLPFLPWTAAGDFILVLLLIGALIMLPGFMRLFKERRIALYCFIIAVAISSLAIIMDSFDVHQMSLTFQRYQQFIEELVETSGMLFFLYACVLRLTHYIGKIPEFNLNPAKEG